MCPRTCPDFLEKTFAATGIQTPYRSAYSLVILILLLLLIWRYSPTWALAYSILLLQTSLSSADLLQFLHFNILLAFLSTYPCFSGPSNRSSSFYVSFHCFPRRPFVLHPQHVAHALGSSQSKILD